MRPCTVSCCFRTVSRSVACGDSSPFGPDVKPRLPSGVRTAVAVNYQLQLAGSCSVVLANLIRCCVTHHAPESRDPSPRPPGAEPAVSHPFDRTEHPERAPSPIQTVFVQSQDDAEARSWLAWFRRHGYKELSNLLIERVYFLE